MTQSINDQRAAECAAAFKPLADAAQAIQSRLNEVSYYGYLPDETVVVIHAGDIKTWAFENEQHVALGWGHKCRMPDGVRVQQGPGAVPPPNGDPEQIFVFRDGNSWCAVYGNFACLASDDAGFGDDIISATANLLAARAKAVTP